LEKAVIVSAVRTPIGNLGGSLKDIPAVELGAKVIAEALRRISLSPDSVEEVIMGQVLQAGSGQNPARQAGLKAGLPVKITACTINEVCASGLKAVCLAAQTILSGQAEVVVAGGMESMSQAPYLLKSARFGYRLGDGKLIDGVIQDGLLDIYNNCHMGLYAEKLAENYNITREKQDEYACLSQKKCYQAVREGKFQEEIVPVSIPQRKGELLTFNQDEFPKPGTTVEILSNLRPAFKENGTVTAGNSSGINDGSAVAVVMSRKKALGLKLKPLAEIVGWATAGLEPSLMGLGPVLASQKVLKKTGLDTGQIDLIELNEAFAVQVLVVNKEMGWNTERVNVNGGAIALGHPIGASGARILVTLLYEMQRRKVEFGLATLCVGGGQGIAMIVKRVD